MSIQNVATRMIPFKMTYGLEAIVLMKFLVVSKDQLYKKASHGRIQGTQKIESDEIRASKVGKYTINKNGTKKEKGLDIHAYEVEDVQKGQ